MKTFIQISLFVAGIIWGEMALAQVGADTSADIQKVESAIPSAECQGLLDSFKHRVIAYNSDTQSEADINAQVALLMTDAQSQARTMNCAQTINMAVETVDVSQSYKARMRQRMWRIVQAIGAAVNNNTEENLNIRGPIATIGVRG